MRFGTITCSLFVCHLCGSSDQVLDCLLHLVNSPVLCAAVLDDVAKQITIIYIFFHYLAKKYILKVNCILKHWAKSLHRTLIVTQKLGSCKALTVEQGV